MLKEIIIQNIQSHKDSKIKLHPGVNVIVGPSDVGKSTILRSLYWLIFNRPLGEGLKSNWNHKESSIQAIFDDGKVTRLKNKSFNGYILGDDKFKGFGTNTPEPLVNFLNMDLINFQSQLDDPFMVKWTPGARGSYLNEITDLEIIDRSISNIKKIIRSENMSLEASESVLKDLQEALEQIPDLDDLEIYLDDVEKTQDKIEYLEKKKRRLASLIEDNKSEQNYLDHIQKELKFAAEIKELYLDSKKIDKREIEVDRLKRKIKEIDQIQDQLSNYYSMTKELEKEFDKLMPDRCPLCGK